MYIYIYVHQAGCCVKLCRRVKTAGFYVFKTEGKISKMRIPNFIKKGIQLTFNYKNGHILLIIYTSEKAELNQSPDSDPGDRKQNKQAS